MLELYKIPCITGKNFRKTEFVGFNSVQVDKLALLAKKGVFFTRSVLLALRNHPNASQGLTGFLNKAVEWPTFRSDDLNYAAKKTFGSFPFRLSQIPAYCLDEGFLCAHKKVKTLIASWDDSTVPYPKELEIKLTGEIGNTELAEKILPLLRIHVQVWRQKWDDYPETSSLYGEFAKIYVHETINKALKEALPNLSAYTPHHEGPSIFQISDTYTIIAVVKKAPSTPHSIW